jgi:hypothetical protein
MARKSTASVPVVRQAWSPPTHKISLTIAGAEGGQCSVSVGVVELIAYSQEMGFTQLTLTGSKVLHVKETTDQIDRLVRAAATQYNIVAERGVSQPA